ncbi:bifunctional 4-hydroxy-2-oxoglutarate aldolase/2-dehydro-3-deoxy-phosphogluconate aldolase [Sediminitomix flava]|uniref:2-dehydro-3-deoxyphosphogluconate aldolase/(4S)-4-hydroxy-2-oxoglutarate aldolase n=1 Tax=Sediminitomix flava TaxID=379075 RepID=A0A315ZAP9_SEDFL|nr:bifunctional 4-hydroxy-2-oxoglutarate aldolase/2-dehydro-3-deoxy-phosphogluconate aldolase [Sediminitomix flava]PWJ41794.1 2-dehydro-3-deoxyphosphogluconate aldolase/(4S)-4-hydroxy-2-oxoglutarate aldolase [Sediminitomix flava]
MSNQGFSWELFEQTPVVGIIRGLSLAQIRKILPLYQESGFFTVEITMNTEGAAELIATLRQEFPSLNIGAGTVCTLDDLQLALAAGAQFIVTPIIAEELFTPCKELNIPIFPGAFSPTEIYKAWQLGASAVKVFPSTALGVGYIKDVLAPLDQIKLLPTGGVTKENISEFLEVGALGVGMGGSLFKKDLLDDLEGLEEHFISIKKQLKRGLLVG